MNSGAHVQVRAIESGRSTTGAALPFFGVKETLADRLLPAAATAFAFLAFLVLVFPFLKSFPYSDDWAYMGVLAPSGSANFDWLIALHNDHRIPIQKLLHVFLLKLTGGDFRALVLLNVVAATIASVAWLSIAAMLRDGRRLFGDAIIPLILLGCGFNSVNWGFSFQFVSSIALVSIATWAWIARCRGALRHGIELCFLALTLCAWSGGNGIIGSLVTGAFVLLACLLQAEPRRRLAGGPAVFVLVWLASLIGLALIWEPSAATSASAQASLGAVAHFLGSMLKSWLGIYAIGADGWKISLSAFASVAATAICGARAVSAWRQRDPCLGEQLVLLGVLAQTFVMIGAVAYSRAGVQPWSPGLELHYGYLTVLLPITFWVVLSTTAPARTLPVLGLIGLLSLGFVYNFNLQWRAGASRDGYADMVAAESALLGGVSQRATADQHMGQFYYVDTPQARESVASGIELLRTLPLWNPKPTKPRSP